MEGCHLGLKDKCGAALCLYALISNGPVVNAHVPTFLGLTLGDVTMMLFWLCIDGSQGRTYHQLMPD
jgi:hypothetical protein